MNNKRSAISWFFSNYTIILIVFLLFFPKVSYEIAKYYDMISINAIGITICLGSLYLFFKYDMQPFYTKLYKGGYIYRFENIKIHNFFYKK